MAAWRRDARFDDPPDWLAAALVTVLADLQLPIQVNVQVGYDTETGTLWMNEIDESDRSGYEPMNERGNDLIVDLANWLQEQFFPESRGAWGQSRPKCPGHSHPARPDIVADEAWWVCPTDQHRVARIGHLEGSDEVVAV
jgi:hypothetical protein